MNNIISKKVEKTDSNMYLLYSFNNLDNYTWIKNLVKSLQECNIVINKISVRELSDYEEGTKVVSYNSVDEYIEAFNKVIFDNSIDTVNIDCFYKNIDFIISVNAHLKNMQITFFDYKNDVYFDSVVQNAINKSR